MPLSYDRSHRSSVYSGGGLGACVFLSPDLIRRVYRFQYVILKAILAGVGFGFGTETSAYVVSANLHFQWEASTSQLCDNVAIFCWWMYYIVEEVVHPLIGSRKLGIH